MGSRFNGARLEGIEWRVFGDGKAQQLGTLCMRASITDLIRLNTVPAFRFGQKGRMHRLYRIRVFNRTFTRQ